MPAQTKQQQLQTHTSDVLTSLRNMEEFAALGQFLFSFGVDVLNLPDFGCEELETALLAPSSSLLDSVRLALIKQVSSFRGITVDNFEEYTRRQYRSKGKAEANPFGDEEQPKGWYELSVQDRVKVLHQLSQWLWVHPDRVREKMKDADEKEQVQWRIEPCGFDEKGNTYYILDDNRLYKRTPWIIDAPAKKSKPKKKATKRRRVSAAVPTPSPEPETEKAGEWSCVCVTLHDWTMFMQSLEKSKDEDEQALYTYINEDILPMLTKEWMEKEKQRQLQEAVANRKRSSRLDAKMLMKKEEEERQLQLAREEEERKKEAKIREKAEKLEKEREARMMLREKRMQERAARAAGLPVREASQASDNAAPTRRSSRRAASKKSNKEEEKEWYFDCVCGANGTNYEDGTEIIACDDCDVWQHLSCQKLPPGGESAEFICDLCKKYKEAALQTNPDGTPKSPTIIKLRVGPQSPEKVRGRSPGALVGELPKSVVPTELPTMEVKAESIAPSENVVLQENGTKENGVKEVEMTNPPTEEKSNGAQENGVKEVEMTNADPVATITVQ
ncbi:hypothetical protein BZA77DRAFT_141942 [Pyronema omphalodes]|nr:hypothetical protein BZA77DRAFT_141942 [Pyronema omphalodes]